MRSLGFERNLKPHYAKTVSFNLSYIQNTISKNFMQVAILWYTLSMTKKKVNEAAEILEAIGQENESKGIEATQHFMKLWDDKNALEDHKKVTLLGKKRNYTKVDYYRIIAGMINEGLAELDVEPGFVAKAAFTKEGVVVKVTDPEGYVYARAFKPNGDPETDYNCVVGLLSQVLDTSDEYYVKKQKALKEAGIIIPGQKEPYKPEKLIV